MRKKMTIAIIGCGRFAQCFVPLFKAHPVVKKVYVCDLLPERAKEYSERFNVDIVDSFQAAISSDEIDSIAIFTQRFEHGPMAIKALQAGKHVYSSVPCAISVDDIIKIKNLVEKTKLTYSMGETGFYRAPTVYCRNEFAKGSFGEFVYGEAQYNHDVRNMEKSFRSSGGDDWKRLAGIPPMFYPTHSTSMILGSMPGIYAKKVTALGYLGREDIYGKDGVNDYNNPFSNTTMLLELSNGGTARVSENRCIGWKAPETYISQFYGTDGCYEFSVARHHKSHWDPDKPGNVIMTDVTKFLQPENISSLIESNYADSIQKIADGAGYLDTSPVQPTRRLPKEFKGIENGHNGTQHFLIDDFCKAYETGKLSPTNIWQTARFNIPGLVAHQSALQGGITMDVPDLGNPPEDWEPLNTDNFLQK